MTPLTVLTPLQTRGIDHQTSLQRQLHPIYRRFCTPGEYIRWTDIEVGRMDGWMDG